MPLAPGSRLGPYEITGPLGEGGMGQVWKARDTRLSRTVAIKTSHNRFSERFEREAQAIAALNLPHICSLYDVGPDYLVMEYVEGQPLKGPVPLPETVELAGQILDALDAAHRKGITHRDLKPGNILISKTGGVKVLDFGLAKFERALAANTNADTKPLTDEGTILGTPQYMSPEQIEGREADARSDIFAFGLVLYELITGRKAFDGKTKTSVIASILKEQPRSIRELQPLTPPALERIVEACLEKDPDKRWQSAREVKHALNWMLQAAPADSLARKWKIWAGAACAVALLAIAIAGWALWPKHPAPARATRFSVPLPEKGNFDGYLVVSPDGRKLTFNTSGPEGGIWVRDLDSLESRLLPGTQNGAKMFWSPDSRYIAFGVGNQLKKIDVFGGPPQTLCEIVGVVNSGTWSKHGVIVFGNNFGPPLRVSEGGGVPLNLTPPGNYETGIPSFLPDGRHFLYFRYGLEQEQGMYSGSIDAKPEQQPTKRVMSARIPPKYVANVDDSDGRLFFLRDDTLMAQPFDAGKIALTGEPVPIAEHVGSEGNVGFFSVSPSGVLAYRTGSQARQFQLTWFDRQGKSLGVFGEANSDQHPLLSPDGTRVAVLDSVPGTPGDIWTLDFARGVRTRFTFQQMFVSPAVWSPDGSRIAFSGGDYWDTIYEKPSSGAGQEKELFKKVSEPNKILTSWSRDGRFLLYEIDRPTSVLWVLPLGGDRKPVRLLGSNFNEGLGSFSPDGRWIAYESDESGRNEIYVRPFLASGPSGAPVLGDGKWQVSKDGFGGDVPPRWRYDGKEIIFAGANDSPTAVEVSINGAAFEAGIPKQLFALPPDSGVWDVTADGKKFLVPVPSGPQSRTPITVVLNWQAELKK